MLRGWNDSYLGADILEYMGPQVLYRNQFFTFLSYILHKHFNSLICVDFVVS